MDIYVLVNYSEMNHMAVSHISSELDWLDFYA